MVGKKVPVETDGPARGYWTADVLWADYQGGTVHSVDYQPCCSLRSASQPTSFASHAWGCAQIVRLHRHRKKMTIHEIFVWNPRINMGILIHDFSQEQKLFQKAKQELGKLHLQRLSIDGPRKEPMCLVPTPHAFSFGDKGNNSRINYSVEIGISHISNSLELGGI